MDHLVWCVFLFFELVICIIVLIGLLVCVKGSEASGRRERAWFQHLKYERVSPAMSNRHRRCRCCCCCCCCCFCCCSAAIVSIWGRSHLSRAVGRRWSSPYNRCDALVWATDFIQEIVPFGSGDTTQISSYFTKQFLTHQTGNYPVTCFVSKPSRITLVELSIINTSYRKLPFGSGDYPDTLLFHQALN